MEIPFCFLPNFESQSIVTKIDKGTTMRIMVRISILLTGLLICCTLGWAGLAGSEVLPNIPTLTKPVEIQLQPYRRGLRGINVEIGNRQRFFLFDTGGGLTTISNEVAKQAGFRPYGQLCGYRMSGERLTMPHCGPMAMAVAGLTIHPDAAVFDIGSVLPKGWPPVDGTLSLHSFRNYPMTLDLANSHLTLETQQSLKQRIAKMHELTISIERATEGRAVDLYIQAQAKRGKLWLLVDSGNIAGMVLAPHALHQLGIAPPPDTGGERRLARIKLNLSGLGSVTTPALVQNLIHDGALDVNMLEQMVLTVDIVRQRAWARWHNKH